MIIFLIACGDKKTTPDTPINSQPTADASSAQVEPAAQPTAPAPPPKPPQLQNNTEQLVKEGILQPLPEQHISNTPLPVQFNTLYPNGCWMQTEATHEITPPKDTSAGTILHSYTTSYEGEGKMCTMGFKPGGFKTEILLPPGAYEGRILVNNEEKSTYSITVVAQ